VNASDGMGLSGAQPPAYARRSVQDSLPKSIHIYEYITDWFE